MNALYEEYKELEQEEIDKSFLLACKYGHLDKVKYLLTSPEIFLHADINVKYMNTYSYPLIFAAKEGHLDVVKYLLEDPDIDIKTNNGAAFCYACHQGQLQIAKYLLSNQKYRNNVSLNEAIEYGFSNALANKQNSVLEYLIFELNIERSGYITEYLKQYSNNDFKNYIEGLFDKREIKKSLEKELICDKIINKPSKIKL
jgi:ankyrin repeat protein